MPMKRSNYPENWPFLREQAGVTLIETIIVLCIVCVVGALGFALWNDYKNSSAPELAATSGHKQVVVGERGAFGISENKTARFMVTSYGRFKAGHNDNDREIMVVTDSETGQKYLFLTGCGGTEMSSGGKSPPEEE